MLTTKLVDNVPSVPDIPPGPSIVSSGVAIQGVRNQSCVLVVSMDRDVDAGGPVSFVIQVRGSEKPSGEVAHTVAVVNQLSMNDLPDGSAQAAFVEFPALPWMWIELTAAVNVENVNVSFRS